MALYKPFQFLPRDREESRYHNGLALQQVALSCCLNLLLHLHSGPLQLLQHLYMLWLPEVAVNGFCHALSNILYLHKFLEGASAQILHTAKFCSKALGCCLAHVPYANCVEHSSKGYLFALLYRGKEVCNRALLPLLKASQLCGCEFVEVAQNSYVPFVVKL